MFSRPNPLDLPKSLLNSASPLSTNSSKATLNVIGETKQTMQMKQVEEGIVNFTHTIVIILLITLVIDALIDNLACPNVVPGLLMLNVQIGGQQFVSVICVREDGLEEGVVLKVVLIDV